MVNTLVFAIISKTVRIHLILSYLKFTIGSTQTVMFNLSKAFCRKHSLKASLVKSYLIKLKAHLPTTPKFFPKQNNIVTY